MVYENGDPDYGIWSAGVSIVLFNVVVHDSDDDILTCEELLRSLEKGVEEIVGNLSAKAKL